MRGARAGLVEREPVEAGDPRADAVDCFRNLISQMVIQVCDTRCRCLFTYAGFGREDDVLIQARAADVVGTPHDSGEVCEGPLQWLLLYRPKKSGNRQMGWFFRKSFRVLPGIRINLSKSGPRLSVGVPSVRAGISIDGKARVFAGKGPVRYQKRVTIGSKSSGGRNIRSVLRGLFTPRSGNHRDGSGKGAHNADRD